MLGSKWSIKKLFIGVIVFCTLNSLHSQNFVRSNEWKKYRKEIYAGFGGSNFLGDLGGLDKIGTDYSIVDMESSQTGFSAGFGYKYKLAKWLNIDLGMQYVKVKGDDKLTNEKFRNNRNLNFKSNIIELACRMELVYMHNAVGNRYGIKNTFNTRKRTSSYDLALFAGIGGFYFNPKGRDKNGTWHSLKPLRTEGQGLPAGPKQYKNFAVCIPIGFAYRYYIERAWALGVELAFRKTFTDYIDDVSTVYYNKTDLLQNYGSKAVEMADPNLGKIYGATEPDASGRGAQRGDIDKDSYITVQLTLGYMIKNKKYKRKKTRLRSRF